MTKVSQQKEYTKTNVLVISNLPEGCTPDQLWQLFSVLCGPAFIAVKYNNSESCLAVFVNQPQARLAQKALEFIIFKNHILSSKGFDYSYREDLPVPQFFQIGQVGKNVKAELSNIIPAQKSVNINNKQLVCIAKMRKSRKMIKVKDNEGSDNEYYPMPE